MFKTILLALILFVPFVHAQEEALSAKDKVLELRVKLPRIYGSGVQGEVLLEHTPNSTRASDSTEVFETILNFIYSENSKEIDHFDPKLGEGIFIPKANLGGFLDTDLLKAKFYPPAYDAKLKRDVYPVDFKFRASFLKHVFKKAFVTAVRAASGQKWKIYYLDQFEVDGMEIQVNAAGTVTRMNLTLGDTVVKALRMSDLPSISESEF